MRLYHDSVRDAKVSLTLPGGVIIDVPTEVAEQLMVQTEQLREVDASFEPTAEHAQAVDDASEEVQAVETVPRPRARKVAKR